MASIWAKQSVHLFGGNRRPERTEPWQAMVAARYSSRRSSPPAVSIPRARRQAGEPVRRRPFPRASPAFRGRRSPRGRNARWPVQARELLRNAQSSRVAIVFRQVDDLGDQQRLAGTGRAWSARPHSSRRRDAHGGGAVSTITSPSSVCGDDIVFMKLGAGGTKREGNARPSAAASPATGGTLRADGWRNRRRPPGVLLQNPARSRRTQRADRARRRPVQGSCGRSARGTRTEGAHQPCAPVVAARSPSRASASRMAPMIKRGSVRDRGSARPILPDGH